MEPEASSAPAADPAVGAQTRYFHAPFTGHSIIYQVLTHLRNNSELYIWRPVLAALQADIPRMRINSLRPFVEKMIGPDVSHPLLSPFPSLAWPYPAAASLTDCFSLASQFVKHALANIPGLQVSDFLKLCDTVIEFFRAACRENVPEECLRSTKPPRLDRKYWKNLWETVLKTATAADENEEEDEALQGFKVERAEAVRLTEEIRESRKSLG